MNILIARNASPQRSTTSRQQTIFIVTLIVIALVTGTALYTLFWRDRQTVRISDTSDYQTGSADEIMYSIDLAERQADGSYMIQGWCIQPGITYPYYNYGIGIESAGVYNNMHIGFLYEDRVYTIPTELERRDDISENMNDGIDYAYSGFYSRIDANEIGDYIDGEMMILLQDPDGDRTLYRIGALHDYE